LTELLTLHPEVPWFTAEKLRNLVFILAACDLALTMSAAGILLLVSFRVLQSKQFPPPGLKMIRATKVRTGLPAKGIAVLCLLCALVVAMLGIGTAASLVWSVWDIPDSPREGAVSV
jgi:hypothetical protein